MATRIDTLPGRPDKAVDYDLGDGKYARVVYNVISNNGQTMLFELQAFEVDAEGRLVSAPSGAASRTPSQTVEVHLSGCTGKLPTMTLKPGWVYVPDNPQSPGMQMIDCNLDGAGAPTAEGKEGDAYWDTVGRVMWQWHPGAVAGPMRDKATELKTIIDNSQALTGFSL